MNPTRNDLPLETRQRVVELLNARLADAIDLARQAKQAHWNVKGPNFIALHELFDEVHTEALGFIDLIAERAVALGGYAEGASATVAQRTTLPPAPAGIQAGSAHVEALSATLASFAASVRKAESLAGELGDAGTADLFTEVSRGVDQRLWMVEAHLVEA